MIKIGLLSATTASCDPKVIQSLVPKGVSIVPLLYGTPEEILSLYDKNHWFLDGILFGGIYSQSTIQRYTSLRIPHNAFKISDSDFLGVLLRLALQGVSDFSRVATDLYSSCQQFTQALGQKNVPIAIRPQLMEQNAYDHSKEVFTQLVREGKVDIVISRFSALAADIEPLGGKFIYISSSEQSYAKEIHTLISDIRDRQLNNNLPAIGLVCNKTMYTNEPTNMATASRQLMMALGNFNQLHSMSLMIHPVGLDCEILTTNADLYHLTDGYFNCRLGEYLKTALDFPVRIGWGVGKTMDEAYDSATSALIHEIEDNDTPSLFQNGLGNRPVPLNSSRVSLQQVSRPILKDIEGIAPRNLLKLYELITTRGLYQMSSEDIAYYLDVTKRSATRIATTLVAKGLAQVAHKQQTKVKGRPALVYHLSPEAFIPYDATKYGNSD